MSYFASSTALMLVMVVSYGWLGMMRASNSQNGYCWRVIRRVPPWRRMTNPLLRWHVLYWPLGLGVAVPLRGTPIFFIFMILLNVDDYYNAVLENG